jgi:FAD/FMN-containing dehydrogenase
MRPWVSAIEVVTGDGNVIRCTRDAVSQSGSAPVHRRFRRHAEPEILRAAATVRAKFPKTRKNTAGYALDHFLDTRQLLDLFIGSEGTLGIVTEVDLTLDPRPACVSSILVALPTLDALQPAVEAVRAFDPAAIEFLDSSYLRIAEYDAFAIEQWAGALLIDFEGDGEQVGAMAQDAAGAAGGFGITSRVANTPDEREQLWALRHAASPVLSRLPDTRRSLQIIEDGCVPPAQLGTYITDVHAIADDLHVPIVAFGHAGDGHLHVNALADVTDPRCVATLGELLHQGTRLAIELGGTPSGEHGDGRLRTGGVADLYGPEILRLFHHTKTAFDPAGILNPGVIITEDADPVLADLKVGTEATVIPDDVAGALRAVERSGNWGVSRLELPDASPPP